MDENIIVKPVYQQIAIDLANRIAHGDFQVGEKIHGRSTLAGQYNVSPETVRRAVVLLADVGVIQILKGSGILVRSKEEAFKYIEKFKDKDSMSSLVKNIETLIEERSKMDLNLKNNINKLIDFSERFKNSNPFPPLEVEITKTSHLIGKTIGEVNFWQNTGATIIGIRRDNELILSPGPYATFLEKDVYIFIGDENSYERVVNYLNE